MVHFHAQTLKLLKVAPVISESAVVDLDSVETRIRRKLPASVREWYSLDGACNLLRQYSNDDRPLEVREFGYMPRTMPRLTFTVCTGSSSWWMTH